MPGCVETALLARRAAARRQDRAYRRHQFRHRARRARSSAAGVPLRQHAGAIFAARRTGPSSGLVRLCRDHGMRLLCYGTVAGGFLSERWLGQPEPDGPLENRSLTKYKLIIDDFGGWALFQALLRALAGSWPTGMASTSPPWRAAPCWTARAWRPSSSGRATARHLAANVAIGSFDARRRRPPGDRRGAGAAATGRPATSMRSSATAPAARLDHEIQPEQSGLVSPGPQDVATEPTFNHERNPMTRLTVTMTSALAADGARAAPARAADCTITVGLVMELTGPAGEYGQAGAKSVEMAFRDINEAGGVARLQARHRHARQPEPGQRRGRCRHPAGAGQEGAGRSSAASSRR